MPREVSFKVEESVSVEYGITVQLLNGSFLKVKAARNSTLRPKEKTDDAYARCWSDAMKQVNKIVKESTKQYDTDDADVDNPERLPFDLDNDWK